MANQFAFNCGTPLVSHIYLTIYRYLVAGQERFRQSMVAHYYRNVNAVVFVYDITNRQSYDDMHYWIDECRKNAIVSSGSRDSTPHIIIGNKCDLLDAATVAIKTDEAQMFADRNDMPLFETSALADSEADHVESIFMTLVHKLKESKPMHVQSEQERLVRNDDDRRRLLLRAGEHIDGEQSTWCC
jgi:Ras-related protein Rab-33B